MFFAAFRSRSWTVPHRAGPLADVQRLAPAVGAAGRACPVDGTNRPTFPKDRPYRAALYSSMVTNAAQPASCTDLASRVRPSPATHRSSTYTAWLSRMIARGGLVVEVPAGVGHPRVGAGHLDPAFFRLLLPAALRDRICCNRRSFRSARRRNFGAVTFRPVRHDRERRQAQVDPDLRAGARGGEPGGVCRRAGLHHERGEVPARRVLDHGDAGRGRGQVAGPADLHVADLRQAQPPVGEDLEPGVGGEPDRLPAVLAGPEPGRPHLPALAFARDGGEEVPVRGVQVREGLLEHHRRTPRPATPAPGSPSPRSAASTAPRR